MFWGRRKSTSAVIQDNRSNGTDARERTRDDPYHDPFGVRDGELAAPRKDQRAKEMYELYQQGKSLSEVAAKFGVTRQTVFKIFTTRGLTLRPLPIRKPYQEFNGNKYTRGKNGYYRKTCGDRSYMHRDVWEFYNGPIPEGWDIHHKDGDKSNNDISNLECLPKSEHTRLYSPHNNQYTKGRKRHANA